MLLACTVAQLRDLTGVNHASLRSDRMRGHSVAAFGGSESILRPRYLLVDGLAWLILDDLHHNGIRRLLAAMIVRGFSDKWLEAASRIEHRREAVVFAVAEQQEENWWCGAGLAAELPAFIASGPPPKRLFIVNVAGHMFSMQERALKAGLDLSVGSWVFPPDESTFVAWAHDFAARRESALRPGKLPPALGPHWRKTIEGATCILH
jgi:hypothetical protein